LLTYSLFATTAYTQTVVFGQVKLSMNGCMDGWTDGAGVNAKQYKCCGTVRRTLSYFTVNNHEKKQNKFQFTPHDTTTTFVLDHNRHLVTPI